MAGNQTRIVELQIKLQGAESIQQLEEVTAEINQELKGISTTSKSFTQMGDLAKKANSRVKEVNESLGGITSTEKSEAINKMGMGLLGAFQGAAGASLLFGEKTSAAMDKAIKQVGGLFAITDATKKITEAFSAKNLAGIKATITGWKESAIGVKLFGNAAKTAIISTGIGALIVAIGVIIANFDKIKAIAGKMFNGLKEAFPFFQKIQDFVEGLKERFGSLGNFIKGVGAAMQKLLQFKFNEIGDAFNAAVDAGKELDKTTENYNKTLKEGKQILDDELAILEAMGGKEDEIYQKKKAHNQEIIDNANKLIAAGGELDEKQKESLHDAKLALEVDKLKYQNFLKERDAKNAQAEKEKQDAKLKALQDAQALADAQAKAAEDKKSAEEKALADAKALEFSKLDLDASEKNLALQKLIDATNESEYTRRLKQQQLQNANASNQRKINTLMKEYAELSDTEKQGQKGVDIQNEIIGLQKDTQGNLLSIKKEEEAITEEKKKQKKAAEDVAKAEGNWQDALDNFMQDYGKLIGEVSNLTMAAFDLAIQNEEAKAEARTKLIEKQQEEDTLALEKKHEIEKNDADKKIEEEKSRQEDLQDSIDGLKNEALDAEGERYQAIQDEIALQELAKQTAMQNEIQAEADKAKLEAQQLQEKAALEAKYEAEKKSAQAKAAKLRKQQSIVDAIIGTALAVLNGLSTKPFFPLGLAMAIVAGIAGGIQIATIKKQPTYAKGGFTGKGAEDAPAGVVHKGEYVVPQKVMRNPQAQYMIESLEGMRLRGYQTGGQVVSTPMAVATESAFDYARIGDEVARAIKENPSFVSWSEWRDMDIRMRFMQSRASLGKNN